MRRRRRRSDRCRRSRPAEVADAPARARARAGLTPTSFRSFNVQNGGICVVRVNSNGEAMIESSNQIAHMYQNDVLYSL